MGISSLLTAALCGAAVVMVVQEAWRRMQDAADAVKPLEPVQEFDPLDYAAYRRVSPVQRQPVNRIARYL